MGGYRRMVQKACLRCEARGKPFTYMHVYAELPDHPEKPTERQVIQEMSTAKYLREITPPDTHRLASYRVRKRFLR